jgi:hypothetical protein
MSVVDLADVTWLDVRHGASVAPSGETLSSDEHARARRYLHARDRDRFIVRRGELRRLPARRGESLSCLDRACASAFLTRMT